MYNRANWQLHHFDAKEWMQCHPGWMCICRLTILCLSRRFSLFINYCKSSFVVGTQANRWWGCILVYAPSLTFLRSCWLHGLLQQPASFREHRSCLYTSARWKSLSIILRGRSRHAPHIRLPWKCTSEESIDHLFLSTTGSSMITRLANSDWQHSRYFSIQGASACLHVLIFYERFVYLSLHTISSATSDHDPSLPLGCKEWWRGILPVLAMC